MAAAAAVPVIVMSSSGRKYPSGSHKRKKKKEADEEKQALSGSLFKYYKSDTSTPRNPDELAIVLAEDGGHTPTPTEDDVDIDMDDTNGLQDKIKIVATDLADRPAWYKQRVYPENKVPSLEHNNQVKGGSLDLVKYIDRNFQGPTLFPDGSAKKQFAEELFVYSDEFSKTLYSSITSKGDVAGQTVAALDKIEAALGKFTDGPFFLGQFSLVDIAYVPFIERFQIFFSAIKNYDITKDRPNIQKFIEEVNKIDAYTQTKLDPQFLLDHTKKRLGIE